MGPICCSETSDRNFQYTLRNNLDERTSHFESYVNERSMKGYCALTFRLYMNSFREISRILRGSCIDMVQEALHRYIPTWELICGREDWGRHKNYGPSLEICGRNWIFRWSPLQAVSPDGVPIGCTQQWKPSYPTYMPILKCHLKYVTHYHIKNQLDAALAVLFISHCKITLHVSDAFCVHHQ